MKKLTFYSICLAFIFLTFKSTHANDTVLVDDFEGNGTIERWVGDQCEWDTAFTNPFSSSANNSAQVFEYRDVGGEYANVRFDIDNPFELSQEAIFSIDVYIPSTGVAGNQPNQVALKLQNRGEQQPWTTQVEIIKPLMLDQWQTVTFDFANDNVLSGAPHLGNAIDRNDFNRVLIQFNGEGNFDPVTAYFDNFQYNGTIQLDPEFNYLVWSDEFNQFGPVDSNKWHHQTQLPSGGSWFNNEIQHYTDRVDNSFCEFGKLKIVAKKETFNDQGVTKQYTSARLNSKFAFQYGRVEVRAKLPTGVGTWPAIWLLGKNINEDGAYWDLEGYGTTPWPACGEIDIMEHWGWNQNFVQSATHTPSSFGATINHGGQWINTASTDFHTYELTWTPEKLDFGVDGVKHYTYRPTIKNMDTWPFDAEQYMILNIAIEPTIEGSFTQDAMEIEYVRIYQEEPPAPPVSSGSHYRLESLVEAFPNPFKTQLTIDCNNLRGFIELTLFDAYGKAVQAFEGAPGSNRTLVISGLDDLPKGVYFLQLHSELRSETIKLMK